MEAKHKAKYRAKLKESKDKWTAYLRKDRQRKQEKKHCDSNKLALKLPDFTSSHTEEQQKWIISLLQRPDLSYTCPGRRDQVYVGKTKDGDKDYRTKHYLLWKLSEMLPLINTAITEAF